MQHRHRRDVGDVLATAREQGGVSDLDVEQNRVEALATEAPKGVGHADHRHHLGRRHIGDQRAYQPGQLAGFLAEQQEPDRLLIARRRARKPDRRGRRSAGSRLPRFWLKHHCPS
jgi:hypothetical protein